MFKPRGYVVFIFLIQYCSLVLRAVFELFFYFFDGEAPHVNDRVVRAVKVGVDMGAVAFVSGNVRAM